MHIYYIYCMNIHIWTKKWYTYLCVHNMHTNYIGRIHTQKFIIYILDQTWPYTKNRLIYIYMYIYMYTWYAYILYISYEYMYTQKCNTYIYIYTQKCNIYTLDQTCSKVAFFDAENKVPSLMHKILFIIIKYYLQTSILLNFLPTSSK